MKKRCAAFALALSLMLTACSKSDDVNDEIKLPIYGAEDIAYEIAQAQYMDISDSQSIAAVLGYPYAVTLTYPADALVKYVNLANNSDVKEGDVLLELDSSELDYDISNQQSLVDSAALSRGSTAGELQYQIELSKLNQLLEEKEAYTIRAPFDGVITSVKRVAEGRTVSGGDVCCTISEYSKAAVYIDGADAGKFIFGQKVTVKIDGVFYDATVVACPEISPTKSGMTVFDLGEGVLEKLGEENPMALTSGWATVYLNTEKKNVLAVPSSAVKSSGSVYYVTLLDGEERYKFYVTPGETLGGYTEILNGISEGDIVIAEGSGIYSSSLIDGEIVQS